MDRFDPATIESSSDVFARMRQFSDAGHNKEMKPTGAAGAKVEAHRFRNHGAITIGCARALRNHTGVSELPGR